MRDRDDERVVVDRTLEVLEWDRAVVCCEDVRDACTARLLRVPDLADRRELPVREDDLRPVRKAQATRERAHARRERRRHGNLIRARVDEAREGAACRFLPLDPVLPRSALLVPVGEVLPVRGAHGVGQRSLRAGVDVHLMLEDREAVAAALGDRCCVNGQGRPFAGPRAGGARSPAR